jgi:peptidoglycan hydrolase CwlO-like protein
MKKTTLSIMMMILSLCIMPNVVSANSTEPITNTAASSTTVPADVQVMYDRLEEIKKTDKSEMSRTERKELRKEVKEIKSELKARNGGVYLSVGAIIIIVLLLIILL